MQHTWLWNQAILKPIQHYGNASFGVGAFEKLHDLLGCMMLRRTKVERADDLGLPPRTVTIRRDFFTEEEEELYNSLFREVERKFNSYVAHGTVLNNYVRRSLLLAEADLAGQPLPAHHAHASDGAAPRPRPARQDVDDPARLAAALAAHVPRLPRRVRRCSASFTDRAGPKTRS